MTNPLTHFDADGRAHMVDVSNKSPTTRTAVAVACLTIYDMLKAVEKGMEISGIRLILKDGGKSGRYEASL